MIERLSASGPNWAAAIGGMALAFVVSYVAAEVVARLARFALLVLLRVNARDLPGPILRRPMRVIRAGVFMLLAAVLVPPSLRLGGIESQVGPQPEALARWLFGSGLRIAFIALGAYVLVWTAGLLIRRVEDELARDAAVLMEERLKRMRTLGRLAHSAFGVGVTGVALLIILRELDIDITPILTGAGIVGLAVGFGAQTLVKDVITGFFLILEDQIRVGDVATINGTNGLVEAINLRTIVLRDVEGAVHIFPNGSIGTLANRTKDYSYAVLDVKVAFSEDVDRVVALLHRVGAELAADPEYGPRLLEPIEVLGVQALDPVQVTLRSRIKTLPQRQWEVGRELRRRIKLAFGAAGVQMPTPGGAARAPLPRPAEGPGGVPPAAT